MHRQDGGSWSAGWWQVEVQPTGGSRRTVVEEAEHVKDPAFHVLGLASHRELQAVELVHLRLELVLDGGVVGHGDDGVLVERGDDGELGLLLCMCTPAAPTCSNSL